MALKDLTYNNNNIINNNNNKMNIKDIKKSSYYVWFLGAQEAKGLRGEEYVKPIVKNLIQKERDVEPFKVTLQVSHKGLKIIQNVTGTKSSTNNDMVKHFIPHHAVTCVVQESSPNDDIVSCILLIYNPITRCPVHVHCYRCDSVETASILRSQLQTLIDRPDNQKKFNEIESRLQAKGLLNSQNNLNRRSNGGSDGRSTSTRDTESSGSSDRGGERIATLYDSLAAELREKLHGIRGPLLLPPRDYDTVHRQRGNLTGIELRRCRNANIVGLVNETLTPATESSGGSSGIGSDDAPASPNHLHHITRNKIVDTVVPTTRINHNHHVGNTGAGIIHQHEHRNDRIIDNNSKQQSRYLVEDRTSSEDEDDWREGPTIQAHHRNAPPSWAPQRVAAPTSPPPANHDLSLPRPRRVPSFAEPAGEIPRRRSRDPESPPHEVSRRRNTRELETPPEVGRRRTHESPSNEVVRRHAHESPSNEVVRRHAHVSPSNEVVRRHAHVSPSNEITRRHPHEIDRRHHESPSNDVPRRRTRDPESPPIDISRRRSRDPDSPPRDVSRRRSRDPESPPLEVTRRKSRDPEPAGDLVRRKSRDPEHRQRSPSPMSPRERFKDAKEKFHALERERVDDLQCQLEKRRQETAAANVAATFSNSRRTPPRRSTSEDEIRQGGRYRAVPTKTVNNNSSDIDDFDEQPQIRSRRSMYENIEDERRRNSHELAKEFKRKSYHPNGNGNGYQELPTHERYPGLDKDSARLQHHYVHETNNARYRHSYAEPEVMGQQYYKQQHRRLGPSHSNAGSSIASSGRLGMAAIHPY